MGDETKIISSKKEKHIPSIALSLPLKFEPFARKFASTLNTDIIHGHDAFSSPSRQAITYAFSRAKQIFDDKSIDFKTSEQADSRTQFAAKIFFSQMYKIVKEQSISYPLKNKNKCIGLIALPHSKLVFVALSEDRDAEKDISTRNALTQIIAKINQINAQFQFELVSLPTKAQYLMLRALSLPTPRMEAPEDLVGPRTRCAEVALMVALNKVGRYLSLKPEDLAIQVFGGGFWLHKTETLAHLGFMAEYRNKKYIKQAPIQLDLYDGAKAWIDIWEPCENHCKKFMRHIKAVSLAGGAASSFIEPRTDSLLKLT